MSGPARIEELRAEAQYARQRLDLYRARMYGSRPTTMSRFRELERISQGAEERFRRALRVAASPDEAATAGAPPYSPRAH